MKQKASTFAFILPSALLAIYLVCMLSAPDKQWNLIPWPAPSLIHSIAHVYIMKSLLDIYITSEVGF